MEIYVIRHGQTNANVKNIFNGHYDEDINETGIEQAKCVKEYINKERFDLIISSPLIRAIHTSNIVNERNVPMIIDDRIIERNMGDLTLKSKEVPNKLELWNYYARPNINNLETIPQIFIRVENFLNELKEKYSNKKVLIVTHAYVTRAISIYFKGIPKDGNVIDYGQKNCEVKKYIL